VLVIALFMCINCHLISREQFVFQHFEAAYEEVRRGRAWAALVIQPNYTDALVERVEDGRYADDATVEASDLGVRMDWSSK